MFLSSSIFLIILYYIRKFLITLKIINLIRASIFALSMFFMFPHYANILNFFYIPLLIVSFGLIINYKNFYKIYFKTKYLLYLLFIILLFVFFFSILKYETSLYYLIATDRSDDFKTSFSDFILRRQGNINEFIGYFMYQEPFSNLYQVNVTSLGIFFIIILFFFEKKLFLDKNFIILLSSILIIFIISFAPRFYFFKNYFMYGFFHLPFVSYVRNILNCLFLFKPIILIIFAYSLNFLIENKYLFLTKKFLLSIFLLLILYTEVLFSVRFNSVDPYMWIGSIIVFSVFVVFYYCYFRYQSKIFFSLSIIVPILLFHIISINSNNFKNNSFVTFKDEIDKVYFDNNLYENEYCFKYDYINKVYGFILPTRLSANHFFLNTYEKPCGLNGFLRIRGSKKPHNYETVDVYREKIKTINSDKLIYFQSPNEKINNFS